MDQQSHLFSQPTSTTTYEADRQRKNAILTKLLENKIPFLITDVKRSKEAGHWTKGEHQKFLEGMKMYGRDWKRVHKHVGTRTADQTRSHAQKFFIKLEKKQIIAASGQTHETNSSSTPIVPKKFNEATIKEMRGSNGVSEDKKDISLKKRNFITVTRKSEGCSRSTETGSDAETKINTSKELAKPKIFTIRRASLNGIEDFKKDIEIMENLVLFETRRILNMISFLHYGFLKEEYIANKSLESELNDIDSLFFNKIDQIENLNEEGEQLDVPLVVKYPTIVSIFE